MVCHTPEREPVQACATVVLNVLAQEAQGQVSSLHKSDILETQKKANDLPLQTKILATISLKKDDIAFLVSDIPISYLAFQLIWDSVVD